MSVTYHERPGVYSDYDASSAAASGGGTKTIAIAAKSDAPAGLYSFTGSAAALEKVGAESELGILLRLAFANGAGTVLASPVASDTLEAYKAALDRIFAEKKAAYVVCASGLETVRAELSARVSAASGQRGECIGFVGLPAGSTAAQLTSAAAGLNSERMVLVGPGFTVKGQETAMGGWAGAAALCGVLAAQTDPALPLHGAALAGFTGADAEFDDAAMDGLIRGGVTVCETVSGQTSVVRGVTTRTKTGGVSDATYRELSTMLIIDEVIPAIRTALRARFARAKNNALTRSAIRSQVIVELESRVAREIIDSYDAVTVTPSDQDASMAVVEFGFAVTHGLSRILLTAHISV